MTKLNEKELEYGKKNKVLTGSYQNGKRKVFVYNTFLGGDGLQKAANFIVNGVRV